MVRKRGVVMRPPTEEVLERLKILHRKLEDEGRYVQSNTVWLAIEEIKTLNEFRALQERA